MPFSGHYEVLGLGLVGQLPRELLCVLEDHEARKVVIGTPESIEPVDLVGRFVLHVRRWSPSRCLTGDSHGALLGRGAPRMDPATRGLQWIGGGASARSLTVPMLQGSGVAPG